MRTIIYSVALAALFALCTRPTEMTGGTTITDNAKVTGRVYYAGGAPAKGAAVRVRPTNYVRMPGTEPDSIVRYDTTVNEAGVFSIDSLRITEYRIEVNDLKAEALLLSCRVAADTDSIALPPDTLRPYTAIAGKVDSARLGTTPLFVQVLGTDRLTRVDSVTGAFSVKGLPPGEYTVRIVSADTTVKPIVVDSVRTDTGVTTVKVDTAILDTTAKIDTAKTDTTVKNDTAKTDTSGQITAVGQWIRTNDPFVSQITCITVSPSGSVFAGTYGGGVFRSTDNGSTWTQLNDALLNGRFITSVAANPAGGDIYVGRDVNVYRSADNGNTWTTLTPNIISGSSVNPDIRSIAVSPDGASIFAGIWDGGIIGSTDNGATWTRVNSGAFADTLLKIYSLAIHANAGGGNTVFAGTLNSGLFRSIDNALTWTHVGSGLADDFIECLAISADGKKIFAGNRKGIFASTDDGTNWSRVMEFTNGDFYYTPTLSMAIRQGNSGGNVLIAAKRSQGIYRSTDDGANWTQINGGLKDLAVNCVTITGSVILAGTDNHGVYACAVGASQWSEANGGLSNLTIYDLVSSGSALFAGTSLSGVYRTMDEGASWTKVNNGLTDQRLIGLSANADGPGQGDVPLFAVGSRDAFRSIDNGASWDVITGWDNIVSDNYPVSVSAAGSVVFACLMDHSTISGGSLYYAMVRSTDNGVTWALPGPMITSFTRNSDIVALSNKNAGVTFFMGTYWDGVLMSSDTGVNWTKVNNGLSSQESMQIKNLAVNIRGSSGAVLFAGANDGLYRSLDSGANWIKVHTGMPAEACVLSLAMQPNSATIFAGTGTGTNGTPMVNGVYRSTDNGTSWAQATGGMPDVGVTSLIIQGSSLYAGTQGKGVWKARLK
jgi:photosystem II stability/assembly factor-like uncharacterized protein